MRRERVLIVEDDESLAIASRRILCDGFDVVVVGTLTAARIALGEGELAALVVDVGLPDGIGLHLLPEHRNADGTRASSAPETDR
ncbi:MAG: hypothetical protein Q8S73_24405 [Deltaproteobacteria bacterium]|nr:hypothetical protein [Myxococcales bacterium]MDP3217276.1 hypothetical protein [Deltaproteobacteria bacterium]